MAIVQYNSIIYAFTAADSNATEELVGLLTQSLDSEDRRVNNFSAVTLVHGLRRLASKDTDDCKVKQKMA